MIVRITTFHWLTIVEFFITSIPDLKMFLELFCFSFDALFIYNIDARLAADIIFLLDSFEFCSSFWITL